MFANNVKNNYIINFNYFMTTFFKLLTIDSYPKNNSMMLDKFLAFLVINRVITTIVTVIS